MNRAFAVLVLGVAACASQPPSTTGAPPVPSTGSTSAASTATPAISPSSPAVSPGPPTASPPAKPSAPIVVTVERGGKTYRVECANLSTKVLDDNHALRSGDGRTALLSCGDEGQGLSANVTARLAVGEIVPSPDEANGRIGLVAYTLPRTNQSLPDITTTSSQSTAAAHLAKGTIQVKAWDAATGRLQGNATMRWDKDGTGQAGTLRFDFDLALPAK